jgi:hypothetical protein
MPMKNNKHHQCDKSSNTMREEEHDHEKLTIIPMRKEQNPFKKSNSHLRRAPT